MKAPEQRLALLFCDGTFGVLMAGASLEQVRAERKFVDLDESDPACLTKIVRVTIAIHETLEG